MTTTSAAEGERTTQLPSGGGQAVPHLPAAVKDAKATRELLFTLRHFHLGDPVARVELETTGDDVLPSLLDPYRDSSRLRYDYPLLLFPPPSVAEDQPPDGLAGPLSVWLQETTEGLAPGADGARVLKDHLPWLEHQVRQDLLQQEGPVEAAGTLQEAAEALQRHLGLADSERERLEGDLQRLLEALPKGTQLLGYGRYPALHLLIHAIRSQALARRERFRGHIDACIRGLKELFEVEWGKSDEAIEPRMARDSVGPGGERFDPAALSAVMDHARGTRKMPGERRARIERALAVLESWQPGPVLVRFVHAGTLSDRWLREADFCREVTDSDPCASATAIFDREAAKLSGVFSAVRVARLEIGGVYDPVIHDPWFANFHWEAFSPEEIQLVPSVIALGSADQVAGEGLRSLSRLLSSGRPVQILIRVQPYNNPGAGSDESPFQSYRTELGYLGVGHRQAVVCQSSAARHQHLLQCFLSALAATRTSLHVINTGLRPPGRLVPLNAWLVAGAAIESRAHPFFRINPQAGDSAAERMDFTGNPQPELDWPVHPFRYLDENGNRVDTELAFTFADYALLIEPLRDHFRVIPPGCDADALVPVQEYLAMGPDEAYQRIPFVWGVDSNAILHRLVISRELALACRDRRNYWRALQEMAGVRNRYVELAIGQTRREERALAEEQRARLQAEHVRELERVRREAAGEAMQRLTDLLLGLDFAPAAGPLPALGSGEQAEHAPAKEPATLEHSPQAEPAGEADDQGVCFDEPWIDTPLCTSCNDCLKINPRLFLYNEEKQALLGDPNVGSYAQLVEAAELCPAKCIHPGLPRDPQEPGLDGLIERAVRFNQ